MRIVIATGIYPPDIGGPATHVADLEDELRARGHEVTVLTLWDRDVTGIAPGLVRFPRSWPWPVRLAAVAGWLVRNRSRYDVVYATGLQEAAVAGARLAGRPVVVKVVGDPAWERGRRLGLTEAEFEPFQRGERGGPLPLRAMRWARDRALLGADAVTTPSAYLAGVVERWLDGPAGVEVIPNGVRAPGVVAREPAADGSLRAVFVGRLVAHKRVDAILEAVAATDGVALHVVGSGPEASALRVRAAALGARVEFLGDLPHAEVLRTVAAADALVLASDYEGLPHVIVEALACGTPVLSPAVGGVAEVVTDGESGLILPDGRPETIASALERLRDDPAFRDRLSEGARRAGAVWSVEATADRVEGLLARARTGIPRAVFFGKTVMPASPPPELERKVGILVRHLRPTLVNVGRPGIGHHGRARVWRFPDLRPPILGGALFYPIGSAVAVVLAAGRGPSAVVCQSPYEGAGALASAKVLPSAIRPRVVIEVHGDWRTATRLYGGRSRRVLAPYADRAAVWALRSADRVRVISGWLEEAVRDAGYAGKVDTFPTWSDVSFLLATSPADPPATPVVAYVGAFEGPKGLDVLLQAWAGVTPLIPKAELRLAGDGRLLEPMRRFACDLGIDARVRFLGRLSRDGVRDLLDASSLLVVPSRSEGMGRVVLEAHARGRAVVATRAGGLPELIADGETGVLVPPEDPHALASAIASLLEDPDRLRSFGDEGRRRVEARDPVVEFEEGIRRLALWIAGGTQVSAAPTPTAAARP